MTPALRLARDIARASTVEECHAVAEKWLARLKKQAPAKTLPEPKRAERKAAKAKEYAKRTVSVRAAVVIRADGLCECGCGLGFTPFDPAELDEFEGGNGRKQKNRTVAGSWLLRRVCHRFKTLNYPDRKHWIEKWTRHLAKSAITIPARFYAETLKRPATGERTNG